MTFQGRICFVSCYRLKCFITLIIFLENIDGTKTFDKEKLNLAFRKKVIEVEEKNQNEENKEGDIQRQMLEAIIANLTDPEKKKKNSITDREPDVYEAYQIILSEHYKREKHQDKKNSTSNLKSKKNKRNSISVPKSSSTNLQKQNADDITNLQKEVEKIELKNDKTGMHNYEFTELSS